MDRQLVAEIPRVRGFGVSLYVRPRVIRFQQHQAIDLHEHLRTLDNSTSLRSMHSTHELQLQDDGRTQLDQYRFTGAAFRQAAQIMAPGLSKLLPDISGTKELEDDRIQLVDGNCAIRFWNELVDLRFPLFERYRIIRNDEARTIEGFVSQKHQYLENLGMYQEVVEILRCFHPHVSMYAAALIGRRFSVWFRNTYPMFAVEVDGQEWPFHSGYYFTNGEATGMSVRGTLAVYMPKGVCLAPYRKYGQRVTHIGRDFMSRLGEMFSSVIQGEVPVAKLEAGARELLTKSLGFEINWNDEQRKERAKKITHSLGLLGVQRNLAAEAVDLALSAGRYQGLDAQSWAQVHQLYAGRKSLDLLVPLLWLARKIDMNRREKLEQAAFDILTGRLLL